ncbi:MAG TPA: penicillin acylase family protein [Polyangia bacterium]|nr:penicillin acylase family protein [Polyangia bacterium]
MVRRTLLLVLLIPACSSSPIAAIPQVDKVVNPALSSAVDVVRDEQGIPHIYGQTLPDVAFVEGYLMGEDRMVQMDLVRHAADGTLAELAGDLSASLIDRDINMRLHHLRSTSEQTFATLQASSDPTDKLLVQTLTSFAAGVNAYIADLQSNRYSLPGALALAYDPSTTKPWTEVDSILIGRLITFQLSFDADSEIARSALDAASLAIFDNAQDPAHALRRGIARDLERLQPLDPTYTFPGDFSTLMSARETPLGTDALALLTADRPAVYDLGDDHWLHPAIGSNNWVIGPALSATGHTMVANDPHLGLQNPATFWLVHLVVSGGAQPVDVMGVQFPGAPGVILGMNQHVAWGATVSNIDVTDVYSETIVACGNSPCVMFKGAPVPLVPRTEMFGVGRFGQILRTQTVTFYDVPHHGPIVPRIKADHTLEPLGSTELSIRWTGHEPTDELRAVLGLNLAKSVAEARAALERDFRVGGQNWVLGDDQGHFGWTQAVRVPRRPAGTVPWKVLPGDGSAEWLSDLDLKYVPHAFDPPIGFLATANADPVGVTDDGDPFASEPMVDGIPLYIAAEYDPGTRVGRITKRINAMSAQKKLTLDDLQAIQADAVTEWGQALAPTFLDAGRALAEEIAQPGTHPDLTTLMAQADAPSKMLVQPSVDLVNAWSFDTPAGTGDTQPTAQQIADSRAALLFAVWETRFALLAFEDEFAALGMSAGDDAQLKLLVTMCTHPDQLATPLSSTGDSILFDDLSTPAVESKRQIAAKAILDMLDYLIAALKTDFSTWRWGQLHTLTLQGLLPLDAIRVPLANDASFPNGWPRHGDNGTVDVGHHGLDVADYTYAEGPNIRFVGELDPAGPHGRDVLPGGEVFDPTSPHYRDLMELWRQNQTFDMAFTDAQVAASAKKEIAAHGGGRVRFQPR